MPRQPRLDVPGALHHIMVRGNNKANIFNDDQYRSKFLQRLGENITEAKCSIGLSYDNTGNIIRRSRVQGTEILSSAATNTVNPDNQIMSAATGTETATYSYDSNGNLISKTGPQGTTTFTWDARNRLVAISGPNHNASFKYDARGRRIEKTINGKTSGYLYDGLDIIQELEGGAVKANYLRTLRIDEVFARTDGNGIRFYQHDQIGSTVALTDENGAVKTIYSYDPFGNTTVTGDQIDQLFQYTGRENDGAGLYYYRARYYSPEMQRFISKDPIGLAGGDVNLYAYVGNNPVNFIDPFGLEQIIVGTRPGPNGQPVPIVLDTTTGQTSIGYPHSYVDPLTSITRDALKTTVENVDKVLNNPVTDALDTIPPGQSVGHPVADIVLNALQLVKGYWNEIKKACQ